MSVMLSLVHVGLILRVFLYVLIVLLLWLSVVYILFRFVYVLKLLGLVGCSCVDLCSVFLFLLS